MRRIVCMGSSGHVVGWLHVKNLDTILTVRGQYEQGPRGGRLKACSSKAAQWTCGLLRELAADCCNFLSEEQGKSISCEVSSRRMGRYAEQDFEEFALICRAVNLGVVKQVIWSSDAGREGGK